VALKRAGHPAEENTCPLEFPLGYIVFGQWGPGREVPE
jgi:hypothetical protein